MSVESDIFAGLEHVLTTGSTTPETMAAAGVIEVEKVIKALSTGAAFDWSGALRAVEAHSAASPEKVYATVEEIASIIGIFVPVAAVVANNMKIAEPLVPVVVYVVEHSTPPIPGAPNASPEGHDASL